MPPLDLLDDAELLARAHEDAAAFGVFYRRHAVGLLAFLTRRAGNGEAGADLTAEVFAVALAQAPRFDPGRGDPAAWLYGIARHQLGDYYRSGAVEGRARRRLGIGPIALDDEDLTRIERLASLEVSARVLGEAIGDLPSEQRSAVIARIVHEHSYEEIGREAAVSPTAARQRVSRGLNTLRQRLGGQS